MARVKRGTCTPSQRKLFSSKPKEEEEEEDEEEQFKPIFDTIQGAVGPTNDLEPGRLGSTRSMPHFPSNHPKLEDFRKFLRSVEGSQKSEETAKQIVADISKYLYFANPKTLQWSTILDRKKLLGYFEALTSIGIKAPGRLTKMERLGDAFKYAKFSQVW